MDTTQVNEQLLFFLSGSLLALLVTLIAHKAGFYTPLKKDNPSLSPSFGDVIFVFLVYFATYLLLLPLGIYLGISLYHHSWHNTQLYLSKELRAWINSVGLWGSVLMMGLLCWIFQPSAFRSVLRSESAKGFKQIISNLVFGMATWLVCFPVVMLVNHLISFLVEAYVEKVDTEQVAVKILKATFDNPYQLGFYLVAIVVLVPMVEEFMFRGILQRWLSVKIGQGKGIAGASACFAALHYAESQGAYNLELLPSLFILSCYLGYLYERQKSLWAPIGLHGTFNLVSALFLIFQK